MRFLEEQFFFSFRQWATTIRMEGLTTTAGETCARTHRHNGLLKNGNHGKVWVFSSLRENKQEDIALDFLTAVILLEEACSSVV